MKIYVQSVNFTADKDLISFVEEKISNLEKFYDRIVDAEAYLKVQQTSDKENKVVEIKLNVPGDELMVKKTAKTFEEGTTLSAESLRRLLMRKKEKQREKHA